MKKILLVFIFFIVITGAAFAEFPNDQLGIGVAFREGVNPWYPAGGLSFKAPYVPIFFAFTVNNNSYSVIIDYYILDFPINEGINLDWYLGAGGEYWSMYEFNQFGFLARVPIGISWKYMPFDFFLEAAPKTGIKFTEKGQNENGYNLDWDVNLDIMLGVRFWF